MVGIDISDRSIKIAEVSEEPEARLRTICWSPVATGILQRGIIRDISAAAAVLQQALSACSPMPVAERRAVVSIPETQSFVKIVRVPVMSTQELDEAVRWAVREHIPFDLDRVYLDWHPLAWAAPAGQQYVLVGAARRDVVDPLVQVLDQLDMHIIALELEAQAIVRCLLPRDAHDVTGVLLVDLGATATTVIYFDQGAMRFTAGVPQGGDDLTQQLAQRLHLQPTVAAEKKALVGVTPQAGEASIANTLRESARELITQVEKIVRPLTLQNDNPSVIRAILLSGGSANLPGITELFSEFFPGIPVQLGNPWTNLLVDDKKTTTVLSTADAVHFTTALGLALRQTV